MKLAGLIQARTSSERCVKKLVRPFADTTLIDLALTKLAVPGRSFPLYFAAHEQELVDIYHGHVNDSQEAQHSQLIRRDEASAKSDDVKVILNYLDAIDEDFIMFINPCHAFLTLATLEKAVERFEATGASSMTSVTYKHTWYYHLDGRPINFTDPAKLDTKTTTPLIEVAHAFHIFHKERFLKYGHFWTHGLLDPYFFLIPEVEAIDVDTELDFEVAETLYMRRMPVDVNAAGMVAVGALKGKIARLEEENAVLRGLLRDYLQLGRQTRGQLLSLGVDLEEED